MSMRSKLYTIWLKNRPKNLSAAKVIVVVFAAIILLGTGLLVSLLPQGVTQRMEDFSPSRRQAVVCAILAVWSILSFSSTATFIYSNF